jgi:hypothetical protein
LLSERGSARSSVSLVTQVTERNKRQAPDPGTAAAKSIDKHTPSVEAAASDAAPWGNKY